MFKKIMSIFISKEEGCSIDLDNNDLYKIKKKLIDIPSGDFHSYVDIIKDILNDINPKRVKYMLSKEMVEVSTLYIHNDNIIDIRIVFTELCDIRKELKRRLKNIDDYKIRIIYEYIVDFINSLEEELTNTE